MKQEMKNVKKVIAILLVYAVLGSSAFNLLDIKRSAADTTSTASGWSEWSTSSPSDLSDNDEVQTRIMYRYRDKETTTSTNSSMSGWTQYNKETTWGNWSSWQDSSVSSSSTREVQTQTVQVSPAYTQYRYGRYYSNNCSKGYWRYFCATCAYNQFKGTWYSEYTDWMNSPVTTLGTEYVCPHYSWNNPNQRTYVINGQNWYWQETRTIPATNKTQYRYRDAKTTYYYYRWGSWSNWSTVVPSSNSNREIENRTEYRFKKATVTTTEATTTAATTTQSTTTQSTTMAQSTTTQATANNSANTYFSNIKVLPTTSNVTKSDTVSAVYSNTTGKKKKVKKGEKIKKGYTFETKNYVFKVTSVKKKTVCFMRVNDNKKKSINIKDTVKYDGKQYKITEIKKGVLKNNKKVTKIEIGKYVTKIEKNAFRGCKNLKTLNVHSKKIKKVGKHAFKDVPRNLNIGVPKGCKDKYKKLFQKGK